MVSTPASLLSTPACLLGPEIGRIFSIILSVLVWIPGSTLFHFFGRSRLSLNNCRWSYVNEHESFNSCLASKYLRNCSDKKEHILRCFQKLIRGPTPDLLDYNLIISVIADLFVLDERYSQISLQLISRDDWPTDLGEVFSDPFYYYAIEFSHGNRSGRSWQYFSAGPLDVKIRQFLREKSSSFLSEYYALMQFCFLEKTIMTGSFFVHHPVDEICNEDRGRRRRRFEKLLIESLTILLKRGLCPRGTFGRTTKSPSPTGYHYIHRPKSLAI